MIYIIIAVVALAALLFASIHDLKTREVPDWLSYSLIATALGIRLIYSIFASDGIFFIYGLLGLVAMTLFGFLMYYAKQWGGGDSKLMMGIGILFATYVGYKPMEFIVVFLINLILIGSIYGLIWLTFLGIKNWKKVKKEYKRITSDRNFRIIRRVYLVISLILFGVMFAMHWYLIRIIIGLLALAIVLFTYLRPFIGAVEKMTSIKRIAVGKLVEGDWIANDIKIKGKVICGPTSSGIDKNQINILKRNKIKFVTVKEGIPFVPSFLITLIITLITGNIYLML